MGKPALYRQFSVGRKSLNMANPKGHPESIEKYQFKRTKKERCDAQMNIRVPESLLKELKQLEDWQDFVRSTLKEAVKSKSA